MLQISMEAARVNAGLTQAQAAAKIGVCTLTLARWEQKKCAPNIRYLDKIAETYGIPADNIKFF